MSHSYNNHVPVFNSYTRYSPKVKFTFLPIPMLHLHEVLHPNLHLLSGAWNVMEGEELPHCTQQHVVEGT